MQFLSKAIVGVDAKTGAFLWRYSAAYSTGLGVSFVISSPQSAGLSARRGHKFVGRDGYRMDAQIFESRDVVQTARGA